MTSAPREHAEGARPPAPGPEIRRILHVSGAVQGVGFRPFVHRTATALGLRGAVWNAPAGVVIDVEGSPEAVTELCRALETRAPRHARIEDMRIEPARRAGQRGFAIRRSAGRGEADARVVPDLAICEACVQELADPADRRFGHPFLNCTDCGPRYSIVREVPYDRAHTTMSAFAQCTACALEYRDPGSRRFHAQPNACPGCGPSLWLEREEGTREPGDPVAAAVRLLRAGGTVAVKGIGGFHLCCDARSAAAVARLRERKRRPAKPFAVMFADLAELEREVVLSDAARALLLGARAPIVLAPRRAGSRIAAAVAPGLRELGVLLPYTPLHHQLLAGAGIPLVTTSGNRSEEPIAAGNEEARARLAGLADAWLLHDREIHARVEDSVVREMGGAPRLLRRARGWVPEAIALPVDAPPLLAVGGDLKNAPCLAAGRTALLGPHGGDLESLEAQALFRETTTRLARLFRITPGHVVHDLHPGYHGTALARASGLPAIAVQHHHAHVAAVLAEHGRAGPVIGVAWDGSGWGPDGSVWGGEVLVADLAGFRRAGRLRPVPLPGGEAAVRAPWRMAVSHLVESGLPAERIVERDRAAVETLVRRRWHAPPTSSMGRLFDAVAALVGISALASYEGQAAAELEASSEPAADPYPFPCGQLGDLLELDPRPLVRAVVRDRDAGVSPERIGGRFHAALARGAAEACGQVRAETGLGTVVLGGGCFQNRLLLEQTCARLEDAGFEVLCARAVPCNDGGLALGQAAIAACRLARTSGRGGHVPGDPR